MKAGLTDGLISDWLEMVVSFGEAILAELAYPVAGRSRKAEAFTGAISHLSMSKGIDLTHMLLLPPTVRSDGTCPFNTSAPDRAAADIVFLANCNVRA